MPADEYEARLAEVTALAHEHLPAAAAAGFIAMLRPAVRLEHAVDGDPVVAQLGGLPTRPVETWPAWEDHGPLGHVLSFDCAPVAATLPGLGLPATGSLAFFYYDGAYDDFATTVGPWDPSTHAGSRVVHTDENAAGDGAAPPDGLTVFPSVGLTAVRTVTWPSYETPVADALWARAGVAGPRDGVASASVDALYEALEKLPDAGYDTHQIGGHACPQQGPVEMEVEQLRRGLLDEPFEWTDPAVLASAGQWNLLLQVASDGDARMMWGDVGQLYYLVRGSAGPEDALFTWQCG